MTEGLSNPAPEGGEIWVGAYVLRLGAPEGALVTLAPPETRPRPAPRAEPLPRTSRPAPAPIDRSAAVDAARAEVSAGRPVEFYGDEGVGKTALLDHLAAILTAPELPDGVLHLSARRATLDDLVQDLYEPLFVCDAPVKISAPQLRELALGSPGVPPRRALVLVDDLDLEPDGVEALIGALPGSVFVLASPERRLWGEGRSLALEGLSDDGAAELFERRLGRALDPAEREAVHSLAAVVGGRPASIALAAGLARAGGLPVSEIDRRLRQGSLGLEGMAVERLAEDEGRAASALAVVGGADASVEDVGAVGGLPAARPALEELDGRGIARPRDDRYGMAAPLIAEVARQIDLAPFEERCARHFATRAARGHGDPRWVREDRVVALEVLDRAVAVHRWDEAVAIARGVEPALALSGRWGAWGHVLDLAVQAARHRQDAASEAWVLHQRGTRALCLGDADQARQDLEDALVLREAIGDAAGAAASRRNLEHVPGGPVLVAAPPPAEVVVAPAAGPSPWFFLALALGIVALLTIILLAALRDGGSAGLAVGEERIDWGERPLGAAGETRTIEVVNESDEPLVVRGVRLSGEGAADFLVVRDGCTGETLEPDERCAVEAAFAPLAAGARAATLELEGGGERRAVTLLGTGTGAPAPGAPVAVAPPGAPVVALSPARVDFGEREIGASGGTVPVTFVNTGAVSVRLAVRLSGGAAGEFAVATDECSNRVIPPAESCIIAISFQPRGAGSRGAVLTLRELATNDIWSVGITGSGVPAGAAETVTVPPGGGGAAEGAPAAGFPLSGPERVIFGPQRPGTRSTPQRLTLQNGLEEEIRIASVRIAGIDAGSFGLGSDGCTGRLVSAGGSCAVEVWFQPTEAGAKEASLVVRDGSGDVAREVVLSGTAR